MTAPSPNTAESSLGLPRPVLAAALISFTAIFFTGDHFIGIPILGIAILASAFTRWRLPPGALWGWMLRGAMFTIILTSYHLPDRRDIGGWYVDPGVMKLAGYMLAGELAIRVWQQRRSSRQAHEVFFLSACVMATAAVTYDWLPIHIFAPLYMAAAIISTRSLAAMGASAPFKPSRAIRSTASRGIAYLLAIGIGFTGVAVYEKLMYEIDSWTISLLTFRPKSPDTIGFSTSHELLGSFNPKPSMMRVLLLEGPMYEPHLRIMAFDTYSRRKWRPYLNERSFSVFDGRPAKSDAPLTEIHVSKLERTADLLPLPLSAAQITCDDPLEIEEMSSLRDTSTDDAAYDVAALKTPDFQGPLCQAPTGDYRQRLLTFPSEVDPRIIALSKQVAGAGDKIKQLFRIEQYLLTHHSYSLTFTPQGEPLSDFILNDRAAHCQYFASALVVMARAIGVPARYVAGFYAHESRGPDQTVVRERDAHAWAECWVDGAGWLTMDATPAAALPDQIYPEPSALRRAWERLLDVPGILRRWLANIFKHVGIALVIAATAVPLIIIIVGSFRRRSKPSTSLPYSDPGAQLVELGRQFDAWLRRRGVPCPSDQTWNDCIIQLKDSDSPQRFVSLYNQARFGGSARSLGEAVQVMNQLESQHGVSPHG